VPPAAPRVAPEQMSVTGDVFSLQAETSAVFRQVVLDNGAIRTTVVLELGGKMTSARAHGRLV
jgi:hypothetical protein